MTFAKKLKSIRKQAGMSQEQLAEKLGVSRQAVTKWETDAGIPDIENIMAISTLFDISIDELLSNERETQKTTEYLFESVTEYDIDEPKRYDMKFGGARQFQMSGYEGEKIRVRLASNTLSTLQNDFKVKIDDIRKRIDVDVNRRNGVAEAAAKEAAERAAKEAAEKAAKEAAKKQQASAANNSTSSNRNNSTTSNNTTSNKNNTSNTTRPSRPSGNNTSSNTTSGSNANGGTIVSRAYSQLGKPYVWGACGPSSFDCSGFVSYCLTGSYTRLGTTLTFMGWTRVSNPQPGDVVTTATHCGIYIGNGQMIHAPHTGDVVKVGPVQSGMIYVRR